MKQYDAREEMDRSKDSICIDPVELLETDSGSYLMLYITLVKNPNSSNPAANNVFVIFLVFFF